MIFLFVILMFYKNNVDMKYKKEILNNILSLGAVDALGLIIPIVTMPILSRALGADLYGGYLLFLTIVMFGYTIVDYGIQYTGTRAVAKSIGDSKDLYGYNQIIRWILFVVYSLVMSIYSLLFLDYYLAKYIIFCGVPLLAGYVLTSSWFFQAVSDTKWLLRASLISRLINLFVILFFVDSTSDLNIVIYSSTYPVFLSGIFLTYVLHKKYNVKFIKLGKVKEYFLANFNVFIGVLAPNFYNAIPIMFLGTISVPSDFAKFAVASRLSMIINMMINVFSKAIYPIISKDGGVFVRYIMIVNILISLPAVIFLLIFGDKVIEVFLGSAYKSDVNYLSILSVGMIFVALTNAFSHGYFLPRGLDAIYRKISLNVSLLSGVISVYLITNYGLLGGALSLTIARFLFFAAYAVEYKKHE
jgi:O-antigen/teichoic acid export membrane protein